MKIVYSWLTEFLEMPEDKNISAQEIARALGEAGIEVAAICETKIPDGVVVGRVVSREKHPNADKLSLCKVDGGNGELLQIVCGAPNVAEGMTVALATVGTQIAPDFKITKAKIRGVESFGMMCSEKELGLSENHDGIMSLAPECVLGKPLADYIPYDATIEIEITPNRGDCLSVLGVAREVSAKMGIPMKDVATRPQENAQVPISQAISVVVEEQNRCPRYLGRLVRNVEIKPSPEWMQRRLSMAGLRPINNVVDITNYILIQYGQPMHAFDYNSIADKKIIVRTAQALGISEFTTLDGQVRKLVGDDLLICDGQRPVALAGVMGGSGSEITETTKDVFLECAFFEQGGVRKTSKRLGLSTDSSYRFERGVDYAQTLVDSIDTAAELIQRFGNGEVAAGVIDTSPNFSIDKEIALRQSRVNKILGITLDVETIEKFLNSLNIKNLRDGEDKIICTPPSYRHDLEIEADLIEEVGRMFGYDNIPITKNACVDLVRKPSVEEKNRNMARHALANFGLNEIATNSMVSEARRKLLTPQADPVRLLNPLNPDMAEMRTTMSGSVLEAVAHNLNRKNKNNRFFEIGKIFRTHGENDGQGGAKKHPTPVCEKDILAIAIEGDFYSSSWTGGAVKSDFFVLKGIIDHFAANCGLGEVVCEKASADGDGKAKCAALSGPLFDPAECASISIGGKIFGSMGRVSDKICKAFGIKSAVYYAGLDITDWLAAPRPLPRYAPLPKFPSLERDFNFVMPEGLASSVVVKEIFGVSDLVKNVRPFDVYRGEKLSSGTKSVTFSVEFRSSEKTLTDDDVRGVCDSIVKVMDEKHGAKLRTF